MRGPDASLHGDERHAGQGCGKPSSSMFWTRDKEAERERNRFYLLPGMGGRAYRRKQQVILKSSVAVGLLISAIIAVALYLINRPHP